jgi:hypothetical protein
MQIAVLPLLGLPTVRIIRGRSAALDKRYPAIAQGDSSRTFYHRFGPNMASNNEMQPTTIMTVRVLIMLGCMVALPLWAIFGSSWLNFGSSGTTHAKQSFRGPDPAATDPMAAMFAATGFAPQPILNEQPATKLVSAEIPASRQLPVPTTADPAPSNAGAPARMRTGQRGIPARATGSDRVRSTNDPPGFEPPKAVRPIDTSNVQGASQPGSIAADSDWFNATQQRLRTLGATYYLLESWGNRGELYRFHCKVAIAGNPDYTRHFEATDPHPARAMQMVLKDVEAWRSGR